ncbi:MAG TPA: nucleoside triphosphate pyrophosphohydrolase [Fimbriimonadaceae bacterium]|nr:nucleoside triphosphate pyrophosphohydrolase [Fimbriimonadaceae bacterium]
MKLIRLPRAQVLLPNVDLLRIRECSTIHHEDPSHESATWLKGLGARIVELGTESIAGTDLIGIPMSSTDELVLLVNRLLGPGGCPWDQAQTHQTLKSHLVEETYEVLDAIDSGSATKLSEELGDLLLQPILHAQIADKNGGFSTDEVANGIVDKLIHRHPHVFGTLEVEDAAEVLRNWDAIKQKESAGKVSILGGVPRSAPALLRAQEVSKRAARAGFEWPDLDAVFDKVREEEVELRDAISSGNTERIASEIGDLLFTAVNVARWCKVDAEGALREMIDRFTRRFEAMEALTEKPLADLSAEQWDELWNQAKAGTL